MNNNLRALTIAGLMATCGAASATTIDTTPSWDGANAVSPWGETNTATYGQTFTVGADTQLDDFTFFVNDFVNPDVVDYQAYVFAWDGVKATGAALFASGAMSTTNNSGADGFEALTTNTGGIALTTGQQYVAFLSASNLFDGDFGTSNWGITGTDAYAGGNFVFMNNGSNFGDLTANSWDQFQSDDLAFVMNFSQGVAEPATMGLFALGLSLIGGSFLGRRRRQ